MNSTQAILIAESKALVVIKKLKFLEDIDRFVFGCSQCEELNQHFLTLVGNSITLNFDASEVLEMCDHILSAIASILEIHERYKVRLTRNELQSILLDCCTNDNDTTEFYCESHFNYFGVIIPTVGISLFEMKGDSWKCLLCKNNALRCKHGKSITLPDATSSIVTTSTNIAASKRILISQYRVLGMKNI